MTPLKRYVSGIHDRFGYRATWLPGTPLSLGDIGIMQRGVFVRVASLADLGIAFKTRVAPQPIDLHYVSSAAAKIEFGVGASVTAADTPASGGIEVQFGEEGAFIFDALGCREHVIADQIALETDLSTLLFEGQWKLPWVLVTQVVKAQSATVLISNSQNSRLSLTAKGNLAAAQHSLAHLDAKLAVSAESGDVTKLIGASGLTLLYRLAKLSQGFFSGAVELENMRGRSPFATEFLPPAPALRQAGATLVEFPWTPREVDE